MGERVNASTLKTRALPFLLAGTGRQPMSFDGGLEELTHGDAATAALNTLSLTAQALRFERPLPPPTFNAEPEIHDERPILSASMRRPLLRLLRVKRPSDDLELALAWAFARSKVRPHPFDLPRMDAFVRANAEHLGLTAQHWAAQRDDTNAAPRNYFDAEDLEDTTWSNAQPAQRARFITERRRQDAAAARSLVEAVWPMENADVRRRLLMALETGLNNGDQGFLEGLAKDRAPRVRSLAQRLLARIMGRGAEHPALKACLERIRRSATGLLKKHNTLALELPATVKEHEVKAWIGSNFSEVSCEELARALDLSESAMIHAAGKDENLLLAMAWMATADRRLDLLDEIVGGRLKDAWEQLSLCGRPDLGLMPAGERLRWAEILVRPYASKPPAFYSAWSWLHRSLEGPVPEMLMDPVVRSPRWLADLISESKAGPEWLELLAAVCPHSLRGGLRAQFAALDPPLTLTALPLLDILDSLEKARHHEP
jgi:hypothetical protein